MRYIPLIVGFSLSMGLTFGSAWATVSVEGLTLERIREAPWMFVGEVKSVETVTDGQTPLDFPKKWQARYTRFTILHGVKGPFYKGDEVELKECADRDLPSQPFCGSLYPSAPVAEVGERFFVVTGPGNPNVYHYQTSLRFPATAVPKTLPSLPLPESAVPEESAVKDAMESSLRMRESESGWLIDLSRLSRTRPKGSSDETLPADKFPAAKANQKTLSSSIENQEGTLFGRTADLNKLIDRIGGRPVEE